jgi:hypothetical protein
MESALPCTQCSKCGRALPAKAERDEWDLVQHYTHKMERVFDATAYLEKTGRSLRARGIEECSMTSSRTSMQWHGTWLT